MSRAVDGNRVPNCPKLPSVTVALYKLAYSMTRLSSSTNISGENPVTPTDISRGAIQRCRGRLFAVVDLGSSSDLYSGRCPMTLKASLYGSVHELCSVVSSGSTTEVNVENGTCSRVAAS